MHENIERLQDELLKCFCLQILKANVLQVFIFPMQMCFDITFLFVLVSCGICTQFLLFLNYSFVCIFIFVHPKTIYRVMILRWHTHVTYAFNEGAPPQRIVDRNLKGIMLLFSFFPRSDLMYAIIIISVDQSVTSKRFKGLILNLVLKQVETFDHI